MQQYIVIGKVFNDQNRNLVQDDGELGVPFVKLYTEEGIGITTDEHGRFHIPGVQPGRHLIKIDGHSLPSGTEFISGEKVLVKITDGLMAKASFAIYVPESEMPQEFGDDLMVMVTQGLDTSHPVLSVTMEPNVIKMGLGVIEKEAILKRMPIFKNKPHLLLYSNRFLTFSRASSPLKATVTS